MLVGLGTSSWALGIGVAVFTFFSGVASAFLLVINIRNGQHYNCEYSQTIFSTSKITVIDIKRIDVSILAVVIALSNFNSFTQQIYTLVNFSDLMLEAFQLATEMFQCGGTEPFPLFHTTDKNISALLSVRELTFAFLGSWYMLISYRDVFYKFARIIILLLVRDFFFSFAKSNSGLSDFGGVFARSLILFASSWSLSPVWWKNQKTIIATKISCFALPALQLGVLRLNVLLGNDFAQLIIMNCISKHPFFIV